MKNYIEALNEIANKMEEAHELFCAAMEFERSEEPKKAIKATEAHKRAHNEIDGMIKMVSFMFSTDRDRVRDDVYKIYFFIE